MRVVLERTGSDAVRSMSMLCCLCQRVHAIANQYSVSADSHAEAEATSRRSLAICQRSARTTARGSARTVQRPLDEDEPRCGTGLALFTWAWTPI